jgi:hypothetical protein
MEFLLITMITFAVTFSLNPLYKKLDRKINERRKRPSKFHIHHSVTGLFILVAGLLINNKVIAAMGIGIYLAHVAEEIYFNKRNVTKAFFILITR